MGEPWPILFLAMPLHLLIDIAGFKILKRTATSELGVVCTVGAGGVVDQISVSEMPSRFVDGNTPSLQLPPRFLDGNNSSTAAAWHQGVRAMRRTTSFFNVWHATSLR